MPEVKSIFREVLPKQDEDWPSLLLERPNPAGFTGFSKAPIIGYLDGQLSMEDVPTMVLCKPKLLPLKSVTLEKLEKMQQETQEMVRKQEMALREQMQQEQPAP